MLPLDLVEMPRARRMPDSGSRSSRIITTRGSAIQGQGPFVWSVIGAIAASNPSIRLGTGSHLSAHPYPSSHRCSGCGTSAAMMPSRFFLGLGTGENLSEHVLGIVGRQRASAARCFEEFDRCCGFSGRGDLCSFREGEHYRIEDARLYTLPDEPIPVIVAAGGVEAAKPRRAQRRQPRLGGSGRRDRVNLSRCRLVRVRPTGCSPCAGRRVRRKRERRRSGGGRTLLSKVQLARELPLPSHSKCRLDVDEESIARRSCADRMPRTT